MISKVLLTLLVLVVAYFFIRRQSTANNKLELSEQDSSATTFDKADLRVGAYMFVVLMLMLSGFLYYQRYQGDHELLTVKLYSSEKTQPTEYRVYRYQLNDARFITVEGTLVKVSANERMEVVVSGLQTE